MAFDITQFGSDSSNVKSILDGVRYYRYFNKDNNTLTTPGYFPADLGLNVGDRIAVVPSTKTNADEMYIVTSVENRVVTVTKVTSGGGAVDSVNGQTGTVVLDAEDVGALPASTPIPDAVQYSTMPTASADNEGQVVQFVGATDTYTNGYFYKCVSDGLNPATYSWTQLDVQPANFVGYATPTFMWNNPYTVTDQDYGVVLYDSIPYSAWSVNQREYRVLITKTTTGDTFDAVMYYNDAIGTSHPTYTIKTATGIFANTILGFSATNNNCVIEFNFASGVNADIQLNLAKVGARDNSPSASIISDPGDFVELNREQQGQYLGTGFDATKTQTLKNVNGVLTWVDD